MKISFRQALVGAVLLGATAAGGALAASAIDDGTTSTTPIVTADDSGAVTTIVADATASDNNNDDGTDQDGTDQDADADGDHAARTDETPLTGDTLAKATAAAQAAVPDGTVDRAENDGDGGVYEVHMTKADGSHVTVQLAADFTVTSIDADQGGPGGHGGHRGGKGGKGGHGDETALTGDEATKVTAAAETAVPGGTIDRVETDAEGAVYEAHVTKADGSHVTVHFNADFSVADIETGH